MSLPRRPLLSLTVAALAGTLSIGSAIAGGRAPTTGGAGCPTGTVCDTTLGLAVVVPRTWLPVPPGKFRAHSLVFAQRPVTGTTFSLRLLIEPYAETSIRDNLRAAQWVATKLIRAERVQGATRQTVTYAGTRGVLIRGLPEGPQGTVRILLARNRNVYLITAPGPSLAPDQRAALDSLRFIPRHGNFLPPVGG